MTSNRCFILCFMILTAALSSCRHNVSIIDKYIEFEGGKTKWEAVKTLKCAGLYDYGGITFPFTSANKAPNQYRYTVSSGGKYFAQAFDGKNGWKIDVFKNETSPTLLVADQGKAMLNESDVEIQNELIHYPGSGITTSAEMDTTIDKVPATDIVVTRIDGTTARYYFETLTGRLLMKKAKSRNPELGNAILSIRYSDYREIDGLKIPFKTVHDIAGQVVLTITVNEVRLNEDVEDDVFVWKEK